MSTEIVQDQRRSLIADMANRFGIEPKTFEQTLRKTILPGNITNEQFAAFLLVAKKYNLDPVTKQIYAFPDQRGGIQPVVSIDGWMNLINSHPQFDGMEFDDVFDESGNLVAITCKMYRKDRSRPTCVTEYMSECRRDTPTWKKWPARMLRHKATIQAARYAFGFAGIMDPDEYERMASVAAPAAQEVEQEPREKGKSSRLSRLIKDQHGAQLPPAEEAGVEDADIEEAKFIEGEPEGTGQLEMEQV